jgi:hypothetical protein
LAQVEAAAVGVAVQRLERVGDRATARGDGPKGFSFEASLIEPVMPYSRSSSSSGMPGGYGARRWIHSGIRLLMSTVASRVLMASRFMPPDTEPRIFIEVVRGFMRASAR